MKKYYIEKTDKKDISIEDSFWNEIESLKIDEFPWDGFETNIHTTAKLVYSDEALTVRFETDEKNLRACTRNDGEPVCIDSCIEFFFGPADRTKYINVEINPLGAMVLGKNGTVGRERYNNGREILDVTSLISKKAWMLQVSIPFDFIKENIGEIGKNFAGNFYKCGSDTGHKHYICWNYVETERPNFHSPQFFGDLIFN